MTLRSSLLLIVLLAVGWFAYLPGLDGGFLFDDFPNLSALNSPGPVDNWPAFWRYITSGSADPIGRPLSLLTFLLDAREWPADPAPFLRTNLCLHLINGALLFALLRILGRRLKPGKGHADAAALVGMGLWLLHPLFVSTTLYIVQREAMLPATFTLIGLIGYVHGRNKHDAGHETTGLWWIVASIVLGTSLALLCKANGALLPLLAWVLDATILRQAPEHRASSQSLNRVRLCLLVLPSLLLGAYLASFLHLDETYGRPWTIAQRLLTEPRVIADYLFLLVVPRVLSTGLFNDAYPISTSLTHPATTLPAIALLIALLAAGIALRKRNPALAAALLFFLSGHVIESTAFPLELYFEHRNYLPAMLLFWPLALVIFDRVRGPVLAAAVASGLLVLCAITTRQRAELWGNPVEMARLWAMQSPDSSRAQGTAAAFESRSGRPDLALSRLAPRWRQHPGDLQLALNYVNAACASRGLSNEEAASVATAFRTATEGHQLLFHWVERSLTVAINGECDGLDLGAIESWIVAASNNPMMKGPGRIQDLETLLGRLALARAMPDAALMHFDRALIAYTTPNAAAMQVALLATAGHYKHAIRHLDLYDRLRPNRQRELGWNMPRMHEFVLEAQNYWAYELALLRSKLLAELSASPGNVPHGDENP